MKDKINSAKNRVSNVASHVYNRRGRYCAATAVAATVYAFHKMDRVEHWNEFLEEKGLTDEFYLPED